MKKLSATAFLIILLSFGYARTQNKIQATLIDKDTKQPVEFASVSLSPNSVSGTMSDDKGRFFITAKSAKDSLYIMHMSYLFKAIAVKDIKKQIALTPMKTNLDTVNVNAMGPRTLLIESLKKIKQKYYISDCYNEINSYSMITQNGQITSLSYNEALWSKTNVLVLNIFVPNQYIYSLSNSKRPSKEYKFYFKDLTDYYTILMYYSKLKRNEIKTSKDTFTMQIIKKDSIETGYIITQTPSDSIKQANHYTSLFNVPTVIKYYINADNLTIEKIEAEIPSEHYKISNKEFSCEINSAKTTLNFRKYQDKYFLANCFSRISYYEGENKDLKEEKILFDTQKFYLNGKPSLPQPKSEIKPLKELTENDIFSFIIDK